MTISTDSLEQQSREFRIREELKFRRRFLRGALLLTILAVAIFVFGLYRTRTGSVMAKSRNLRVAGQPTIVIREFGSFLDDSPQYRFECYRYSYRGMWSCQSYVGKSFRVTGANIEWSPDGTATVYLGQIPYFTCKDGQWADITHQ